MTPAESLDAAARSLVGELRAAGKTVATAESCTGGWIAKSLTDVAGSSACFGYGVVSYSNDAKTALLGVAGAVLDREGAVSEAAASDMARGVLALSGADLAVAVSGIAGPDGGTPDKPVGTVWFAWARRDGARVDAERMHFAGDRRAVRAQSVLKALNGLRERLGGT